MSEPWYLCQLVNRRDIELARKWLKENIPDDSFRDYFTIQSDNKVVYSRNFALKNKDDVLAFCLKFHCY